jgi:hypothetical protein
LVAIISFAGASGLFTSVTDDAGNTWLQAGSFNTGQAWTSGVFYVASCINSTKATVTVATTSSSRVQCSVIEYSHAGFTAALDNENGASSGATNNVSVAIATNFNNDLMVMGGVSVAGGTTFTHGGSFNTRQGAGSASPFYEDLPDCGTAGTITSATGTLGGGSSWIVAGASFKGTATTFSITGSAGTAGATISWSGTASGSTTADGSGNYTISGLSNGSYTITPSKTGFTFSPTSSNQTVSGANITGVNFTVGNAYSVPDCRVAPFGPNTGVTNQGTILYTGQTSSNPAVPGTDSRVSKPVDSRVSVPTNSRTPGTYGPGE